MKYSKEIELIKNTNEALERVVRKSTNKNKELAFKLLERGNRIIYILTGNEEQYIDDAMLNDTVCCWIEDSAEVILNHSESVSL